MSVKPRNLVELCGTSDSLCWIAPVTGQCGVMHCCSLRAGHQSQQPLSNQCLCTTRAAHWSSLGCRKKGRVSLELSACASKVKPTHLLETCCYSTCTCMRALLTSQLYQLLKQFKKHLKTKFEKCTKLALIAGSKHTY